MTDNVNNPDVVVAYINKYVEKNAECYKLLEKMMASPAIENAFNDEQWSYIIKQAWTLAYAKAMEDDYLSPDEKAELNNINQLGVTYQNKPRDIVDLNYKLYNSYKKFNTVKYPKPSPFDNIFNKG